ncbi:SSI family serine proteinase inhibitor [Streptomyces sp. NPDC002692]
MTRTTEALRGVLSAAAVLLTTAATPVGATASEPTWAGVTASERAPVPVTASERAPIPAAASGPAPVTSGRGASGDWLYLTVTRGEASPVTLSPVRVPAGNPVGAPPGASSRASRVSLRPMPRPAPFREGTTPGTGILRPGPRHLDTPGTLLLCAPPRGPHPHAERACAELAAAGGDIGRIPATSGALCPMIYAPVTAAARGEWDGRPVAYARTFANSCVLGADTGAVFALGE